MYSIQCGFYFRAGDAILDIILQKTEEGATVAIPVFTCNSTVIGNLKACKRKIEWIDVEKNAFAIPVSEIDRVITKVDVVILHSYWGSQIKYLNEIKRVVKSHNKILIIDYAHRLEVDYIENYNNLANDYDGCFQVYSLSKELPYLLGGLCMPAVRVTKISASLKLIIRSIIAGISMWATRKKLVFLVRLIGYIAKKKGLNSGDGGCYLPRPMTFIQLFFIRWHLNKVVNYRNLKKIELKKIGIDLDDLHIWAEAYDVNDVRALKTIQLWPEFQVYESEQLTDSLKILMKSKKVYSYEF